MAFITRLLANLSPQVLHFCFLICYGYVLLQDLRVEGEDEHNLSVLDSFSRNPENQCRASQAHLSMKKIKELILVRAANRAVRIT